MNIFNFLFNFMYLLFSQESSNTPTTLDKIESKSRFEVFCDRICPYVLLTAMIILVILIMFVLAKYGANLFSTPQNRYEHLSQIVTG